MCKGVSGILTKDRVCWTPESNSHEVIKKKFGLPDGHQSSLASLAPFEVYPRGKSGFSKDLQDWEILFENKPADWFLLDVDTDRVMSWLVSTVMPEWRKNGIVAPVRLDYLGYREIAQDFLDLIKRDFDCGGNCLTQLSLPNCEGYVDCSHNRLTELSLPVCKGRVDCAYNQLTQLDLPACVDDVRCHCNQLTRLSLPVCKGCVCCSYNRLTKLSLPKCEPRNVDCRYNAAPERVLFAQMKGSKR
jgi:Leucine-rich repeat (LRR) protein